MAKKENKKNRNVSVDMTDVETSVLVPEGDYQAQVAEVSQESGESSGKPYLKFKLEITSGEFKGNNLYHTTSLQPQALFNLKNTLIALGLSVPNKLVKLNLDELEGRTMGVTVEHETYEGRKRARVVDVFAMEGSGDDEDEDEVDLDAMDLDELLEYAKDQEIDLSSLSAKDKKKKSKVKEAIEAAMAEEDEDDEDDEDEEDEEVDLESMDLDELLAYAKEKEIDLSGLSAKDKKKKSKVKAAIEEAQAEEDEDEDEGPDLDSMSLEELVKYAKDNDIELSKKAKKDIKLAKKAIAAAQEDDE